MTTPAPKTMRPRMWGRSFQWTEHDELVAVVDVEDEAEAHLAGEDPDARGRAAEHLLGPAARGAVRR